MLKILTLYIPQWAFICVMKKLRATVSFALHANTASGDNFKQENEVCRRGSPSPHESNFLFRHSNSSLLISSANAWCWNLGTEWGSYWQATQQASYYSTTSDIGTGMGGPQLHRTEVTHNSYIERVWSHSGLHGLIAIMGLSQILSWFPLIWLSVLVSGWWSENRGITRSPFELIRASLV